MRGASLSDYVISSEDFVLNCPELFPLYAQHYREMQENQRRNGIELPPLNARLDAYYKAYRDGYLINYVVRKDGEAVGYANVYTTNDMHNGDLIAREDTIFVRKDHRNGVGVKLMRHILADMKARGCRRGHVMAATDPRVVKLWKRLGFKEAGMAMIYVF